LQFNLKRLTLTQIQDQLQRICADEAVRTESGGLNALARGAEGSMRDALSLLDQAIAFGGGEVSKESADVMLGMIDRGHVIRLLDSLAAEDGSALLNEVAVLDEYAPDYGSVLEELMGELQRLAVIQLVGYDETQEEHEALQKLAATMTAEDVQLYYQIALQGRRDLGASRDLRSSFEMTLLRMLAFRPRTDEIAGPEPVTKQRSSSPQSSLRSDSKTAPPRSPDKQTETQRPTSPGEIVSVQPITGDWEPLLRAADVHGAARQLAEHCTIKEQSGNRLALVLAEESAHLNTDQVKGQLEAALSAHLGQRLKLDIAAGAPPVATPAQIREAGENQRMRKARSAIEQDPNVKAVQAAFDAVVEADSIQPMEK
jgi:DNA polymerase-3 subunit gamma/tau